MSRCRELNQYAIGYMIDRENARFDSPISQYGVDQAFLASSAVKLMLEATNLWMTLLSRLDLAEERTRVDGLGKFQAQLCILEIHFPKVTFQ